MGLVERVRVGRSPIHGRGLFASRRFRKGGYIATFEGRATTRDGIHVLWVQGQGGKLTGIRGENALRYLNHSCIPNAEFRGVELFAVRNIQPGAEILIHYGDDWEDVE